MQKCRCDDRGKEDNRCFLAMIHKMHCPVGADCGHCQKLTFTAFLRNTWTHYPIAYFSYAGCFFTYIYLCCDISNHSSSSWPPTLWHLAASRAPDPSRIRPRRRPCTVPCMRADCWPPPGTSWAPPQRWESMGTRTQAVRAMGIMLPMELTPPLSTLWWVFTIIRFNNSLHSSNESWC